MAKISKTVAFVGGSITEMHVYRPRVMSALRAKYPDVTFTEIAAGISSTCSDTGAFRLEGDVLAKGCPDLFFVEECANDDQDGCFGRTHTIRGMEGIIRRVRQTCPECVIVVGLMMNLRQYKDLLAGKVPFHNKVNREVAAYYGLEVADVGAALAKSENEGGFSWAQYRDAHPSPEGSDFAAKVVMDTINKVFNPKAAAKRHLLPPPMDEKSYFNSRVIPFEALKDVKGWRKSRPDWDKIPGAKRAQFVCGDAIWSETIGASFTLKFSGTSAAAIMTSGPDVGAIEVSVDGGDWRRIELVSLYSRTLNYPHTKFFADDLADCDHEICVRLVAAKHEWGEGRAVRFHRIIVNGKANKQ